ncbi:MAG: hypothetical protein NZ920_01975 [Aigarchaeota archaeon]|nr:hypothetical protein [Aigarchaeota archaeon]MDW8092607.1 hypothetical protein [Nitrososphaerota archaeon]
MLRYEYEIPRGIEEVRSFFYNPKNLERVWPREFRLRLLSEPRTLTEGAEYDAAIRLLGQDFNVKFRVIQHDDLGTTHETVMFPFGKLWHRQRFSPIAGGVRVEEEFEVRGTPLKPIAERVLKRALDYRVKWVLHFFGLAPQPTFNDPFRIPLSVGNALSALLVGLAVLIAAWELQWPINLIGKFVAWFLLWFFTHDLAHYVVGSLLSVRFSHYFVGLSNLTRWSKFPASLKPLIVVLGIKINRKDSRGGKRSFAAMYLAGPVASMVAPFIVPLIELSRNPLSLLGVAFLVISLANLIFSLRLSSEYGCIAKSLKVLRS